ncbi:hypothetical protein VE03_08303 [Pseudogymnoascus sp. 23342-1-I1]|nr:hypothetical protein VE03_08303 [Pseudogymnoascus sp. 23342-1-I1]
MKFQLNVIALLALVSSRAAIAFPTESENEDIALADAATPETTQEIPVETDDTDETVIAANANYKDYGKYANYGTYQYTKYGNYRSYGRDATPETTREIPVETEDDEAEIPAETNYKNYGKYANYGKYPPPGYGQYGTYGRYPSRRSSNDDSETIKYGSYDGYGPRRYGKYTHYPTSKRNEAPEAPIEFAKYTKYGKPPGGYNKYPDYARYETYKRSATDADAVTVPPPWNYRKNLAPDGESSADAEEIIVPPPVVPAELQAKPIEISANSKQTQFHEIIEQTHIDTTGAAAMRLRTLMPALSALLLAPPSTSASHLRAFPFSAAYIPVRNPDSLFKRQSCPADYNSCASLSATNSASNCCAASSVCALDNVGNIACCPLGSYCTGIISTAPSPTTAHTGSITSAPTQTQTAAPATGYVPNTFYPFPIIFASGADFSNEAQCESAYESCAGYYQLCTQRLGGGGGGFGVTVAGPGGGITVAGGAGVSVGIESATKICSSLSGEACPGTEATCTAAGVATTTPSQTGFAAGDPGGAAAGIEVARWEMGMVAIVGLITGWGI